MTISELSQMTGVSARMLRYFEQQKLLEPSRNDNKYRHYTDQHKQDVLKICEWQRLGLTLKEIKILIDEPKQVAEVVGPVFQRERESYLLKQKSLQDLRERLTGKKNPYFESRVLYAVPKMTNVVVDLEKNGFKNISYDFFTFSEFTKQVDIQFPMIGEMIYQSSFYLLLAQHEKDKEELKFFMAIFCKVANKWWNVFDGSPPKTIDSEDLSIFFAPSDIIIHLQFFKDMKQCGLILPYQAIFTMAKSIEKTVICMTDES